MIDNDQIAALHPICSGARLVEENGQAFVYLPDLKIVIGNEIQTVDALLCPSQHSGYLTRLFLSKPIAERPTIKGNAANWTVHQILSMMWHTWSWQNVSADLPLPQMLLAHVGALK